MSTICRKMQTPAIYSYFEVGGNNCVRHRPSMLKFLGLLAMLNIAISKQT